MSVNVNGGASRIQTEFCVGVAGGSHICSHYRSCFLDKYNRSEAASGVVAYTYF